MTEETPYQKSKRIREQRNKAQQERIKQVYEKTYKVVFDKSIIPDDPSELKSHPKGR